MKIVFKKIPLKTQLLGGGILLAILVFWIILIHQGLLRIPIWAVWGGISSLLGGYVLGRLVEFRLQSSFFAPILEKENRRLSLEDQVALFEDNRQKWIGEAEVMSRELERREKELADRLVTYHEWLEFPKPILLGQPEWVPVPETENWEAQDKALAQLLDDETKRLFQLVLDNYFMVDGELQISLLREELLSLTLKVVAIYQPGVSHPFLGTSMAQVLQAVSRVCLQWQVVLDELPIKVKDMNIRSIYHYVRQALNAYGAYCKVEPYLSYANHVFYFGRFAMGANPISLGAWWLASTIGKQGVKTVTSKWLQRQALTFFQSLIRTVAYEVANIYGGNFRYRDPNWIYAVELVELAQAVPTTREGFRVILKELTQLLLRGEYDRIFLIHCLAARKSPLSSSYDPSVVLTSTQRRLVADHLERIIEKLWGKNLPKEIPLWTKNLEKRFHLSLNLAHPEWTVESQVQSALRSLVSFLLEWKDKEIGEAVALLRDPLWFPIYQGEDREAGLEALRRDPPFIFEAPHVEAESPLAAQYLESLIRLAFLVSPREEIPVILLMEAGASLRQSEKEMRNMIEEASVRLVWERMRYAPRKVPAEVALEVFRLWEEGEQLVCLYDGIELVGGSSDRSRTGGEMGSLWLMGTHLGFRLFQASPRPTVWWKAAAQEVRVEPLRGLVRQDCSIIGGTWLVSWKVEPSILVPGSSFSNYDRFFQPLLKIQDERSAQSVS